MKNLLESLAILLVVLLSLSIVYFIVQYNLIEDDNIVDDIVFESTQKKVTNKVKNTNYLNTLEGYGDDVDVKVDATQENQINTVVIKSEVQNDELVDVVQDKAKSDYMENLEQYAETATKENLDSLKPQNNNVGQPQRLDNVDVVDKTAMDMSKDIGAVVDDTTKTSYVENLDTYAEKAKVEKLDTLKPKNDNLDDPEKLDQDEIVDEIGMAIDAALDDL